MNSIARYVRAMVLSAMIAFNPQVSKAQDFDGNAFLEWERDHQRRYLNVQLVMAMKIAARIKPALSQCIANQFFGSSGLSEAALNKLLGYVSEHSEFHPSSIVVVVLENECGSFG